MSSATYPALKGSMDKASQDTIGSEVPATQKDEYPTLPGIQSMSTIQRTATDQEADDGPAFRPTREFTPAFTALCILGLACALDATSLSVALPTISTALDGTVLQAFWSGTSFLLASTVVQPTVASLSNTFGRKHLIYLTCIFFAAGSLVAALADNFSVLLAGRTIQGIGGGGLLALTEIVITDLVPLASRGQWLSVMSGFWAIGTVSGPLIGAGFSQKVSWRWIFYINLPVIAVAVVLVYLFLNQTKVPGDVGGKLARFDWLGSTLFTTSLTGFLFGLTTGGVIYDWSSWRVLAPLIIGPIGLGLFGFWEFRYAKEPIINKGIFNNWDMIVVYIMTVFHGMILWSILYFLILYYQAIKLFHPILSAVAALPETVTIGPAALLVGITASKTGHYRWSLRAGWLLTTLGAGLLLLLEPSTPTAGWIWLNIPVGVGTGMLFPATSLSVQAASPPGLNGEAAAFFSFLRTLGQAVGVAVSGVVFQNVFRGRLLAVPGLAGLEGEYSRDATAVVEVIQGMGPGVVWGQLVEAYNGGLQAIYVSMIVFAGVCLVLAGSVRGYSLQQEHVTRQGLVRQGDGLGVDVARRDIELGDHRRE
ncbi:hypothetical protein VP1G_04445 [Cytospora mali]|uniref:Major facilitator superfamily (MFS) profile domain-containing protein n=1 Tax=Cytospora mali TaxID=578113 RepID=A0A194UZL5_CYTMA|nr:hypothetical protein VP1G_04445 [Valsa mali var. pyri (nom. inval.)]